MLDGQYRKRLADDLPRWREQGWVSDDGAAAILSSVNSGKGMSVTLATMIAFLGAILLGFGVFAFVGANWDYMPRVLRFGLLLLALALAYGAAAELCRRDMIWIADVAVLIAGFVFAASIALVGQTYHLAGEFSDAILLWLVGMAVAILATRSISAIVIFLVGAVYWTSEVIDSGVLIHWGGLVAILFGAATATWADSRLARRSAMLALAVWMVMSVYQLDVRANWPASAGFALLTLSGLAFWAGGLVLGTARAHPRLAALGRDLEMPSFTGVLLALAMTQVTLFLTHEEGTQSVWLPVLLTVLVTAVGLGAWAHQKRTIRLADLVALVLVGGASFALAFWNEPNTGDLTPRLATGSLVLAGALWWMSLGHAGHPLNSKFGMVIFCAEVLYLYSVTLGSLMDTAIAFLIGGVLFIAMAVVMVRLDRRLTLRPAGVAA
ncbi:DUF2157 domain-containing protein [Flaviflagellibacter deserti]|uniref:DUF2157 domain-containing protein n=1 Tax=Flaviflagellibacter deserti TaxID=2267266 RepID=A0ABV9Z020_9HYPH